MTRAALGNAPMRSGPVRLSRVAASAADASSSTASTDSAYPASTTAGRGERHPPAGPLEQRHPGLPLERGELLGDRGRRVGERLGGRGDRAAAGQFEQQAEPVHVDH